MKYILLLLLTPLLLALNTNENSSILEYTLTGETSPHYEGEKVYLYNTSVNRLIDSTSVIDSTFSFKGKFNSEVEDMAMAKITIAQTDIIIVLEEGSIAVNTKSDMGNINGTPHNEILNTFTIAERKLYSDLQRDMNIAQHKLESEDKGDEALLQQKDIELVDKYNCDSKKLCDSTFNANRLNIIGAYLYPRTLGNEPTSVEIGDFMSENTYAREDDAIIQLLSTTRLRDVEDNEEK